MAIPAGPISGPGTRRQRWFVLWENVIDG
jgi:hypothetical protein